ncbi:GNAT family N-acetyltransferase [Paenibacillus cellulositrophicus]|uniref:GNAT family N-acetyltransferase n=1 Tax=Paenibacillus cellulositrophicus TaxID=562959 RepID=UPI00203AF351|nr:GNAT family N-acetyltransferase [Paenibacillus cellulositrophicus]MCM2999233.1 GNAT family N-acetyltransferase [Paenibacillus cellulositrophicus]
MLKSRPADAKLDFFHYSGDMLTGFLALYPLGGGLEVCGMVHPDYRRQGIFTDLWQDAKRSANVSVYKTVLLNTPASSSSGIGFIESQGGVFCHSEYQMKWHDDGQPVTEADPSVRLRNAELADMEDIIAIDQEGFEMSREESAEIYSSLFQETGTRPLIIKRDGVTVGKVSLEDTGSDTWIYGFAVKASVRGQGIGRSTLMLIVSEAIARGRDIWLEVAVQNPNALRLYESCGFKVMRQQDYYEYMASQ